MIRLVSSSKGKPPPQPRALSARAAAIEAIINPPGRIPARTIRRIKAHMAEARLKEIPAWQTPTTEEDR